MQWKKKQPIHCTSAKPKIKQQNTQCDTYNVNADVIWLDDGVHSKRKKCMRTKKNYGYVYNSKIAIEKQQRQQRNKAIIAVIEGESVRVQEWTKEMSELGQRYIYWCLWLRTANCNAHPQMYQRRKFQHQDGGGKRKKSEQAGRQPMHRQTDSEWKAWVR